MAEYFPLLDRAVSGLTESTAEARRSIYERARTALIGQLRRMDPPVPEEDIARESAALDEAIARVEARFDHGHDEAAAKTPAAGETVPAPTAPARIPPPSFPTGTPPVVPPPSRERPVLGPRPAAPAVAPASPAAVPDRPVPPRRGTRPVMTLRPVVPVPAREEPGAGEPAPAETPPPGVPAPGTVPRDEAEAPRAAPSFADALAEAGRADEAAAGDALPGPKPREGASRPQAPRAREARDRRRPAIVAGCIAAALVMAGIGFAAYRMRDRPEQVVAARAAASGDAGADAASSGKVADRAALAGADAATDGSAEPAASGVSVPAPVPQGTDAGAAGPAIAVAQRAALLVDAPEDPQRVRTYVGSVVWHLDSVNPGNGQPLATAVKADIDIPDAKLKVTMLMQKNPEPQLPASHTIELHFLPQPGNTLGPIKQVNVPEMRRDDDAPTGDPLAGVPVAITEDYFLVGLSRGAAENQNIRLLTERNWFDMSVLFTSGKLGKLTFEKGASGQRVIEDALKAWK